MAPTRKWFPKDKTCPVCQKVWRAESRYQIKHQVYCSRKCRTAVHGNGRPRKRTIRNCKNCGDEISVVPCQLETKWFCSRSCSVSYNNRGEGNPQWRGGDRLGKYWKRQARERDNYTCQFKGCGKAHRGKGVHAHHIVPKSIGGADSLDNLVTLCSKHHREIELDIFKAILEESPEMVKRVASRLYSKLTDRPSHLDQKDN